MHGKSFVFTSESVTEGHPDKMADAISDAVLDANMRQDKACRVACETLVATGMVVIAGEITSKAWVNYGALARDKIRDIGYNGEGMGFDAETCAVLVAINRQSPDISQGVTPGQGLFKEQGAGDQGMMFGYACDETQELMPMPSVLSHKLAAALANARRKRRLPFLRPDGKSQVSVRYEDGKPVAVETVVVSTQHSPDVAYKTLREAVIEEIILKNVPKRLISKRTMFLVNPTGRFVVGGPQGDTGVTGRKIIVDTYGGMGRHGGGAFSGKDPSKVDRTAAYMARHVAKNIVAARLAARCEVQLAYAIGYPDPVSVMVETFGTGTVPEDKIADAVRRVFPLKPALMVDYLRLLRPIFGRITCYGHFGKTRDLDVFTWEKTDKAEMLKKELAHA